MAAAVETDTIQGIVDGTVWFHLDLENDVLYLQQKDKRGEPLFGEETPEGFTVLRTDSGLFAGMTVVDYWRQFGRGEVTGASIRSVQDSVADWVARHYTAHGAA